MTSATSTDHRFLDVNGLRLHIAERGSGPLVILLHGFPECWYSWRHQLQALGEAGFHAVAPDQRGYCRSDRPEAIGSYTLLHLVGDVIGLMDALGEESAVVVGHDWGAPVAWHTALMRPDRVRGVAALSVPYRPRPPGPPLRLLRDAVGEGFYQLYFQEPGVADAELSWNTRSTFRRFLFSGSGEGSLAQAGAEAVVPAGGGFLDIMSEPEVLPDWLHEADIDVFVEEFERSGFTGGLNWYRNIDRNWELTAAWRAAMVEPPALFVTGDHDLTVHFPGARRGIEGMARWVANLRQSLMLPRCGHWTQQERPAEVNAALLEFLRAL
jgi:pimeloyl-ACP methyl ester carboxylesterase